MHMKGFYSRKIHSLLGIIPLGLFFVNHLLANFSAVENGKEGFDKSVAFINGLPLILVLEFVMIYLPMLFHGVYGLYIAYQAKPNVNRYGYERNWRYLVQRITGVIAFVFIIWHVYDTRVQVALGNITHEQLGGQMYAILSNPVSFVLYTISVVAVSFHFANGLWSFLVSWGITVGARAQRVSSFICMGVFAVMSVMFIATLFAFRGAEFSEATSLLNTISALYS